MVTNPSIIIQARMDSTRLPGKVMMEIKGKPMLKILFDRIKKSGFNIILATSRNKENDILENLASREGVNIFRGSEDNVLERFYKAAKEYNADPVFRLTGDNPLLDHETVLGAFDAYQNQRTQRCYLASGRSQTFPLGISVELFSFSLLEEAYLNCSSDIEKEHVTPYMHMNKPGDIEILPYSGDMQKYHYRLTVDSPEDFALHKILIEQYNADSLSVNEIIKILDKNPELVRMNMDVQQKSI